MTYALMMKQDLLDIMKVLKLGTCSFPFFTCQVFWAVANFFARPCTSSTFVSASAYNMISDTVAIFVACI